VLTVLNEKAALLPPRSSSPRSNIRLQIFAAARSLERTTQEVRVRIAGLRTNVLGALLIVSLCGAHASAMERAHPDRATIAAKAGLTFMFHRTPIERLTAILKSGKLIPGKDAEGTRADESKTFATQDFAVVFLSVANKTFKERGRLEEWLSFGGNKFNQVMLVFSLQPLNRDDYHLTDYYAKGQVMPYSRTPDQIEQFAREMHAMGNEVVFRGPVALDSLREIWVGPGTRMAVLDQLKHDGISQVNGRPIESVVVARRLFAADLSDAGLADGRGADDKRLADWTDEDVLRLLQESPEVASVSRAADGFHVKLKVDNGAQRDAVVRRIAPFGHLPPQAKETVWFDQFQKGQYRISPDAKTSSAQQ
jgi:hypothetical protein